MTHVTFIEKNEANYLFLRIPSVLPGVPPLLLQIPPPRG